MVKSRPQRRSLVATRSVREKQEAAATSIAAVAKGRQGRMPSQRLTARWEDRQFPKSGTTTTAAAASRALRSRHLRRS